MCRPQDFLYQTVIHMVRDDNLAFVQTCWTFTNSDSLLTWAQKVRAGARCCSHACMLARPLAARAHAAAVVAAVIG